MYQIVLSESTNIWLLSFGYIMRILSAPERSVPVLHWRYAILAIQAMRAAE
jgi:hypothetical protein